MNKITTQPKHHWLLIVAMICTSLTSFAQVAASNHSAELGYDLDVQLSMTESPALHEAVPVMITITSNHVNFSNLELEIKLSDGLQQSKPLTKATTGPLYPLMVHENEFQFTAEENGQHTITVKASGTTEHGLFKDRYAYLKFTVDSDPSKNQMGWDMSTHPLNHDQFSEAERPALKVDPDGMITIYDADENLNEISKKVPLNYFEKNSTQAGTTVTISGRYRFRNRENTYYLGYYRNLMRLVNASTDEHLDWTYTDDDGNFTFDPVENPDSQGLAIRIYSARFFTDGGYGVCFYPSCDDNAAADGSNHEDFFYQYSGFFTAGDGAQDIGTLTTEYNLTDSLRTQWIKYDMDEAHIHMMFNSNFTGPITAEWAYDNDDHGNHYHPGGNIHFKSDVGNGTNHTVMHEIGHNVMWNAGTLPAINDCPDPHFVGQVSAPICAWSEGWASAFSNFVNNQPIKCFPPSTTNCVDYEIHSSFTYCVGWYCGPDSDLVEGHVTGAIWDLYDSDDDDFDIESFNRDLIYDIVENDTNDSIASFWDSWIADGNSDHGLNSLFQNDIVLGSPYEIRVNNTSVDNTTPSIGQVINVTVSLRNLGDVSSVATNIKFYLSTNSTISSADQLMATDFWGVLDNGLAAFSSEAFAVNEAGTFYVGACFDDLYGFDTVFGNNCSYGEQITVSADDLIFASNFD
ncbi:MAG: hypothetical protein ACSHWU_01730 [Marinicella sp.]